MQHLVDAVVDVVGVEPIELGLHRVEPLLQPGDLRGIGLGGDVAGQLGRLALQGIECGQAFAGLVQHGTLAGIVGLLLEQGHVGRAMLGNFALVRMIHSGQDPHQRGLARAVGPDQADPFAPADLKADPS